MDWGRFGVRVAQRDIPKLGDMLDSMDDAKVAELQVRWRTRGWGGHGRRGENKGIWKKRARHGGRDRA